MYKKNIYNKNLYAKENDNKMVMLNECVQPSWKISNVFRHN